jgi:alpha-1,6-mannosyltransferase
VSIAADRVRPVGEQVTRLPSKALDRLNVWDQKVRRYSPVDSLVRFVQAPVADDIGGSRFLVKPAVLGFVASALVMLGAIQPGSAFVLEKPDAWFFGVSGSGASTGRIFFGLVCVYAGIILFVRVWLGVVKALSGTEGVAVKKLAWLLIIWSLPVLLAPPLFSHDIYSYAAQGELVTRHINPYIYGPSTLGSNTFTNLASGWWINTPSPYGPFFMQIAGALTSISQHNALVDVVLLKLVAFAGVILIAVSVPSLARGFKKDAGIVFALAVLNPVTIFHLVGGAHNDALMIGLLVAGLALAQRKRRIAGIALCALAAAVKAPAAIGIVYIGWEWAGQGVPLRVRLRPLVKSILIGAAIMAAISLLTGLGWGWIGDLGSADAVRSWLSPATGSGLLVTDLLHVVGVGASLTRVLTVTRGIGLLAAALVCIWLLLRSDRDPEDGRIRAIGLSLLWVVILSPVVQPWYLSWGIVLLAPVAIARSKMRRAVIGLSIAAVVIGLPDGQLLVHDLLYSSPLSIAGALLLLLGVLVVPLGHPGPKPEPRRQGAEAVARDKARPAAPYVAVPAYAESTSSATAATRPGARVEHPSRRSQPDQPANGRVGSEHEANPS